jgi:protein-S-isoprenylcysteine O-methyltransferase Ste14
MRKPTAVVGSSIFFAMAPGIVAGLIPWWLTGWDAATGWTSTAWLPARVAGWGVLVVGAVVLIRAFARFVTEGLGTPAPIAPPQQLVVGGAYRYVRNPMYLAVLGAILGQALVLGRLVLLGYAAIVALAVTAFVHWHEEPALTRQFGDDYREYRANVPGWWPRRRPRSPPSP